MADTPACGYARSMPQLLVQRLHPNAVLPRYAHDGPFGDLAADLFSVTDAELPAGATVVVATGLALALPEGFGALVEDRSGLAVRGITTLAGVIDTGYRGELKVVLLNTTAAPVMLAAGSRVAQLRVVKRLEASFLEVDNLDETARNHGGFGSTGT